MRRISFIFLFLLTTIFLSAQDTTVIIVTGKIIDAETLKPVASVFLMNTAKSYGSQSDSSGKYRILMLKSDSIRISCIGYYTEYWKPDFSKINNNEIRQAIYIKPQTYQLSAVNIFLTRWKAFANDILNTEIKEDATEERIVRWFDKTLSKQNLSQMNPKVGIQIPIPLITHRERQLAKIKKLEKIDKLEQQAKEKYNKQFVSDITGLKGSKLNDFMKYCSFDRDFILKTSEYNLIIIVKEIYLEYQEKIKKEK